MKTKDAVEHFGSVANLAKVLKISRPAISQWGEFVPDARAFQLQVMTAGLLQHDSQQKDTNKCN